MSRPTAPTRSCSQSIEPETGSMGGRPSFDSDPGPDDGPTGGLRATLGRHVRYNTQSQGQEPAVADGRLRMELKVHPDPQFKTRLLCVGHYFLTVPDGAIQDQLAATVDFSIFTGRPSTCFHRPGDQDALSRWAQDWYIGPLTDARYKNDCATKEHLYAVRALYRRDGSVLGPDLPGLVDGPQENDSLIYISKIVMEPMFTGKGLLKTVIRLLLESVSHKNLYKLCRISGPVCWILEPGFINSTENANHWPLQPHETQQERMARVTAILTDHIYPTVDFEVYRADVEVFGNKWCKHTYMGRRVYVHPPTEGASTGRITALASKYPTPAPAAPKVALNSGGKLTNKHANKRASSTQPATPHQSDYKYEYRVRSRSRSPSASTTITASSGSRQARKTPPTSAKNKPPPRSGKKRKADDSDEEYCEPRSKRAKPAQERQPQNESVSNGARPLRSNCSPNVALAERYYENSLRPWHLGKPFGSAK